MAVVSLSSVVVPWPGTAAPRPRKHSEGQAHVGAGSAAPIPGACACGGCFPSVKLYRLCCIFLLFLVQLKFPEGRAKNEATGQRIPRLFTPERPVLYFWKFETQLGTKAMREEGELGAGGRGRAGPFPPHPGRCPSHWTPTPALGATAVQWVTGRESSSMSHELKFV